MAAGIKIKLFRLFVLQLGRMYLQPDGSSTNSPGFNNLLQGSGFLTVHHPHGGAISSAIL